MRIPHYETAESAYPLKFQCYFGHTRPGQTTSAFSCILITGERMPSGQRVLVVNPLKEVRSAVAACLSERYEVAEASSGREALALLESGFVPDLIMVDFLLPDFDPNEFLFDVRNLPHLAGIPIIALTGLIHRAGTENADAKLPPSFRASDLHDILRRLRTEPDEQRVW